MVNDRRSWSARPEPVRVEGVLQDAKPVHTGEVEGLVGTVVGDRARYGDAYHVTFPPTRNLDLWVAAVLQAWRDAQGARDALARELPAWMRPSEERINPGLAAVICGQLRCGKPIPPTGVRPATVLAERVQFPGLDASVLCRAEELWRRACEIRRQAKPDGP